MFKIFVAKLKYYVNILLRYYKRIMNRNEFVAQPLLVETGLNVHTLFSIHFESDYKYGEEILKKNLDSYCSIDTDITKIINQKFYFLRIIPDLFKKIIVNGTAKPWRNEKGFVIIGIKYFLLNRNSLIFKIGD